MCVCVCALLKNKKSRADQKRNVDQPRAKRIKVMMKIIENVPGHLFVWTTITKKCRRINEKKAEEEFSGWLVEDNLAANQRLTVNWF